MKMPSKTNHWIIKSIKRPGRYAALWLVLVFALLWSVSSAGQSSTVFNIPPNDTEAFLEAIREANKTAGQYVIRLADNSEYAFDLINNPPESISVTLTIEGQNSRLVAIDGEQGFGQLFVVGSGASLGVSNLTIRGFHSKQDSSSVNREGLISVQERGSLVVKDVQIDQITATSQSGINGGVFTNAGKLLLESVRISNVTSTGNGVVIWNEGTAELENVLIIDSVRLSPAGEIVTGWYIFNANTGELDIRFSTFIATSNLIAPEQPQHLIFHDSGGFILSSKSTVTASILVDLGCSEVSAGYNLINDPTCESPFIQQAATDLVGVSPGPLLIESQDGYVVIPQNGSPAQDGVKDLDVTCPLTDVLGTRRPQDGNGDGIARCDIGAFEKEESARLFAGGENGVYYDASQDGHYVTLEEVRPNVYLIKWETFDLNGQQAWIFALGSRVGDTISGDAFIMPHGVLIPGGGADVNMDALQDWGTITLQLFNCRAGEFRYASSLPQFGSGSFPLDRLAFIEGLGCRSN